MSLIRKLALLYSAMFFFVAIMGYIPTFVDESGKLFGLFALDLYDNSLHAFSGLWALFAACTSDRQARLYFRLFGTIYFLDGVFGLLFGSPSRPFRNVPYPSANARRSMSTMSSSRRRPLG